MSVEHTKIRRIDVGEGIYVLAAEPEASPAGAPAAGSAPSDFGTARAWKVGRVAIAAASCAAALALLRLGVTGDGVLAAGVLAVLIVLSAIDLQARVLRSRIQSPTTATGAHLAARDFAPGGGRVVLDLASGESARRATLPGDRPELASVVDAELR